MLKTKLKKNKRIKKLQKKQKQDSDKISETDRANIVMCTTAEEEKSARAVNFIPHGLKCPDQDDENKKFTCEILSLKKEKIKKREINVLK